MRMNVAIKTPAPRTAQGGPASRITDEQRLRRLSATCMLWEDNFYIDGASAAGTIVELVGKVSPEFAAAVAYEARTKQHLRHLPLLIVREMARLKSHKHLVGLLLPDVIQRADEITEFLALYWKDGKQPLSAQVKQGLAAAFHKFDEYQLAKYNRDGAVKLRDALFLCHAKPKDPAQEALWRRLVDGKLATPDTWEVQLSGGADKRATFERLMAEGQLGGLAWLRNLRGMHEAGVTFASILAYADKVNVSRVLPFRFLAAARHAPVFEPAIEKAMFRSLEGRKKFDGKTVVLVDVSGSMSAPVSGKSEISRLDAACGVAIVLRELCDDVHVFAFSNGVRQIPARRGFALRDAVGRAGGGTQLGAAVLALNGYGYDRLVVITDEQSADRVPDPVGTKGYMLNVASERNGVGYGKWMHIDGWSEACLDYIRDLEDAGER